MKKEGPLQELAGPPAVLLYQLLCLGGLALVLVVRLGRGIGLVDLLVIVIGLLGVVARLRLAPVLLLLLVAAGELVPRVMWGARPMGWYDFGWTFRPDDVILCCGVLGYVVAHFRLQGLVHVLLPLDRRLRERPPRPHGVGQVVRRKRSPALVHPVEVGVFLLSLPLWALLAQAVWYWLAARRSMLDFPHGLTRFLLLTWALGVGGLVVSSLLGYWKRRGMKGEEAALLLQDTLWRETRREQRRLSRWLTWSRVRRETKEKRP
jgi:hypothetical protein